MDDVHHHKNELTSIKNPSQFTIFLNIDLRIHRKIPGQKKIVNWENLLYSSKKRNRLKNCYSISYQWIKSLKMFFINVKVEKIFFLLLLLQWRAQKGWLCHQSSTFYVACTPTSPNVWIQTYFFGIPMYVLLAFQVLTLLTTQWIWTYIFKRKVVYYYLSNHQKYLFLGKCILKPNHKF